MGDFVDPLIQLYIEKARGGDTQSALIVLQYFAECLEGKRKMMKDLKKYFLEVIKEILNGQSADIALHLKNRKRGRPKDSETNYLQIEATDAVIILMEAGFSLQRACDLVAHGDKELKYLDEREKEIYERWKIVIPEINRSPDYVKKAYLKEQKSVRELRSWFEDILKLLVAGRSVSEAMSFIRQKYIEKSSEEKSDMSEEKGIIPLTLSQLFFFLLKITNRI